MSITLSRVAFNAQSMTPSAKGDEIVVAIKVDGYRVGRAQFNFDDWGDGNFASRLVIEEPDFLNTTPLDQPMLLASIVKTITEHSGHLDDIDYSWGVDAFLDESGEDREIGLISLQS